MSETKWPDELWIRYTLAAPQGDQAIYQPTIDPHAQLVFAGQLADTANVRLSPPPAVAEAVERLCELATKFPFAYNNAVHQEAQAEQRESMSGMRKWADKINELEKELQAAIDAARKAVQHG